MTRTVFDKYTTDSEDEDSIDINSFATCAECGCEVTFEADYSGCSAHWAHPPTEEWCEDCGEVYCRDCVKECVRFDHEGAAVCKYCKEIKY